MFGVRFDASNIFGLIVTLAIYYIAPIVGIVKANSLVRDRRASTPMLVFASAWLCFGLLSALGLGFRGLACGVLSGYWFYRVNGANRAAGGRHIW
jgi:hypothetical protein